MKHKIGIYKITSPSKRIYIGQSINILGRFDRYKKADCKKQIRLHRSLLKHGAEKHKFEILCECKREELNDLEIYYIDLYQSFNHNFGLNLREGGRQAKPSEETKEKMRLKLIERHKHNKYIVSEETRKKLSIAATGRRHSKEFIEKITRINKKENWSEFRLKQHIKRLEENKKLPKKYTSQETREKLRIANVGKKASQETRDKLSKIRTGRIPSQETRDKISKANKGKKRPGWTKQTMDCHKKRNKENPKKYTPIVQKLNGKIINEYASIAHAKRKTNVCYSIIKDCLNKKIKTKKWGTNKWDWEYK